MYKKREIRLCQDGSQTIYSEEFGECYHSDNSSTAESQYIFIMNGLEARILKGNLKDNTLRILEYGFGTGLNAIMTLDYLEKNELAKDISIEYTSLEKYPLEAAEYNGLDYYRINPLFQRLHEAEWGKEVRITERFSITKIKCDFRDFIPEERGCFDIIYFDAFSPTHQPELWTEDMFRKISDAMNPDAILSTYCSKGTVKQALRDCGLMVKRIKGIGRKRHMVTAHKCNVCTDTEKISRQELRETGLKEV